MSATTSVTVPYTLADALRVLAATPDATVLAGGTDLMVELNSGRRQVSAVIAVSRVLELRSWSHDPTAGLIHIGAGITYDGMYYVETVTHNLKHGEYKQSFELSRNGLISTVPQVAP